MTELIKDVDVCIGIEPLQLLDENGQDIKDRLPETSSPEDYKKIMSELHKQFGIKYIAMTKREHLSVNRNRLHAFFV